MTKLYSTVVIALLAIASAACGDAERGGETDVVGSTGGATDVIGHTGGETGTGGTPGASGGSENVTWWGGISLNSFDFAPPVYASVVFLDSSFHSEFEAITVGSCTTRIFPGEITLPSNPPDAGRISVRTDVGDMVLEPGDDGLYDSAYIDPVNGLIHGGDLVRAVAEGADVPSFELEAAFPQPLRVLAPAAPEGTITVARTDGLTLALEGGSVGETLQISGTSLGDDRHCSLVCRVPLPAESVTIPPELLAPHLGPFSAYVSRFSAASTTIGDFDIELLLYGDVANSDRSDGIFIRFE